MSAPQSKTRSPIITPTRVLIALLGIEPLFYLSDHFQWFPFNQQKGWTVLIAVASVAGALLLMLLWYAASLLFRWRFQFTIRSLLLLVLVVAGPNAWLVQEWKAAQRQRRIIETARAMNCGILFDENIGTAGAIQMFSGPRPPLSWLQKTLGEDFFRDVAGASPRTDEQIRVLQDLTSIRVLLANDSALTDEGLRCMTQWKGLEHLELSDTAKITDAGLEHLRGLPQIQFLRLRRCNVSDAGMATFENLKELRVLDLGMTKVADEGFKHFRASTALRQVSFWGNKISDASMPLIKTMPQLETLELGGASITDAGLENLKDLAHLQRLFLRGTKITDSGLAYLSGLHELRELDLFNTPITAAGLKHLYGLKKLEVLYLGETHVSAPDRLKFNDALPNCKLQ
jgi:hypothetical protein